jgi:hypothetical protein
MSRPFDGPIYSARCPSKYLNIHYFKRQNNRLILRKRRKGKKEIKFKKSIVNLNIVCTQDSPQTDAPKTGSSAQQPSL